MAEYNLHGDVLNQWWGHLDEELGDFQFVLYVDSTSRLVFAQRRSGVMANTLCALAAETPRDGRRRGLAGQLLTAMRELAQRQGLAHLVAPVRPSWEERYPLTPIDTYIGWRRADGQPLDPWMRVHERLGARVATTLPRSMRITGTVSDWESWTGLDFPESGDHVFPEGLTTVQIDIEADQGSYWDPTCGWCIPT